MNVSFSLSLSSLRKLYTFAISINVVNGFRSVPVELSRILDVSEPLCVVSLCTVHFCKISVTADAAAIINAADASDVSINLHVTVLFMATLFPSINTLCLLTDLRSTLRLPIPCIRDHLWFIAAGVPVTATSLSPRDSSHQALPWGPTAISHLLHETLRSTRTIEFSYRRGTSLSSRLRSCYLGTCDFTLAKLLLEPNVTGCRCDHIECVPASIFTLH